MNHKKLFPEQISALNKITVAHLTDTGYYAGTPLCTVDKEKAISNGETFIHAMYCPQFILDSDKVCQACLKIWNEA